MSDITTETIDRILSLATADTLEVDGFTYLDKDKTLTLFKPPVPTHLTLSSLVGFVDLLEHGFEAYPVSDVLVHVVSHEEVTLIARDSDKFGRRQTYIYAMLQKPEREFAFNTYMPQEDFVIRLRSLFQQDSQLDDLVQVAGNLSQNTEVKQQDDGFTQRVTMKAGVVRLAEKTILPRVTLTPFRTFGEAKQPSSEYVFRVKHEEGRGNMCALFDADGGRWKLQAIENVKEFLSNRMKGSTGEGVGDIPVVA